MKVTFNLLQHGLVSIWQAINDSTPSNISLDDTNTICNTAKQSSRLP